MTDYVNQSPINAYFGAARQGNAKWWTWLVVAWAGVIVWIYGQAIFGAAMAITLVLTLDMDYEATQAKMPLDLMISFAVVVFAPIIAAAIWSVRDKFAGKTRQALLAFAVLNIFTSIGAVVYLLKMGGGDEGGAALLNQLIAVNPLIYMFMLLMFPPLAIGLWLGVRHVQERPLLSLHTAARGFRWKRMFFAMFVLWTLWGALAYTAHISGISKAEFVFDPARYWKFFAITLLLIPLQSATEEIMLRGYLNQGLGQYIKNPWVVFVITSAGFAALHLGNPEVAEAVKEHNIFIALSGYFAFGMFACVLTYIDGGLETAIGMHAANNMFAAAIVGYDNSALPVPTLFHINLNMQIDTVSTIFGLSILCLIMYKTRRPL